MRETILRLGICADQTIACITLSSLSCLLIRDGTTFTKQQNSLDSKTRLNLTNKLLDNTHVYAPPPESFDPFRQVMQSSSRMVYLRIQARQPTQNGSLGM